MNKMIYNDLDGEIEYARIMIDRIIIFPSIIYRKVDLKYSII